MFTRVSLSALAAPAFLIGSASVSANDRAPTPPVVSDLVACRAVVDSSARLACYDSKTAALDSAVANKDLVVMSREAANETRRGLFGFSLPRLGLFRSDEGEEEQIKELTSKLTAVSGSRGRWVVTLEDGAVWEQTDGGFVNRPKEGQTIKIERAALGSFFGRVNDGKAFRIKRQK